MPFRGFQRHSFSLKSIRDNAPRSRGVYGISNAREWIFVGSGEDMQEELLGHLNSRGSRLLSRMPTGFTIESIASQSDLAERRERLVSELSPSCNPRRA